MSCKDLKTFFQDLESSKSLKEIDFSNNNFNSDILTQLLKLVKRPNNKIAVIKLGGNKIKSSN